MNYYYLILASSLGVSVLQAAQTETEKPFVVLSAGNRNEAVLEAIQEICDYRPYSHGKVENLSKMLDDNDRKYGLLLWTITAWRRLYIDKKLFSGNYFEKSEEAIIATIKTTIGGGASMQGIRKMPVLVKKGKYSFGWELQGKHILHLLFEMPRYSSIMCELWQEIKLRPNLELINYSDRETEQFIDTVLRELKKNKPDMLSKLEFLWQYGFLPQQWLNDLQAKILQTCKELPNKFNFWFPPLVSSRAERKKLKQRRSRKIVKEKELKRKLYEFDLALSRLLRNSYQQNLLHKQQRGQLVDSNIITRD